MAEHPVTEQSEERAEQRNAVKDSATERQKMAVMGRWLDAACAEVGVDRALIERITGPALGLISDVAHGPSRPGAPMTALVLGLAVAPGDGEEQILERIARLVELARTWEDPGMGAGQ